MLWTGEEGEEWNGLLDVINGELQGFEITVDVNVGISIVVARGANAFAEQHAPEKRHGVHLHFGSNNVACGNLT